MSNDDAGRCTLRPERRRLSSALRLRLADLPEYAAMRRRHEQIVAHVEAQAQFLDERVRAAVLDTLRQALDADLRAHMQQQTGERT